MQKYRILNAVFLIGIGFSILTPQLRPVISSVGGLDDRNDDGIFVDFTMIQESVWMGYIALPEDFLKDLKFFNLLLYVKIFSVIEIGNV